MIILYKLNRVIVSFVTTIINKLLMCISGVVYGKGFRSCGLIHFRNYSGKYSIVMGKYVNINSCGMANPVYGNGKTYLITTDNGKVIIGDNVGLSNCVLFSFNRIEIGPETTIGAGTKIYDSDFHSTNPDSRINGNINIPSAPVLIGKRVFIGSGVTILKGVKIGDESVVGAGSVITHSIPSREVWAGNPARFIRKI